MKTLKRKPSHEHAASIVLITIALLSIVAALGIALDSGRLYLAQQRLQQAIDNAVIGNMDAVNQLPAALVADDARALALKNLELARLATNITALNANVNTDQGGLLVSGALRVPLFFLPILPGIPREVSVAANASSGSAPLAVVLVLDTSGSMDQPLDAGGGSNGTTKLTRMQQAAIAFISRLSPNDFLGIIEFNTIAGCRPRFFQPPVRALARVGRNLTPIINNIIALDAEGDTCIACGLECASILYGADPPPPNTRRVVVLLTDGVPNHGDYFDDRPIPILAPLSRSCGYTPETGTEAGLDLNRIGRRRFYQAIAESDLLRARGIEVHTIGVGAVDPVNGGDICRGTEAGFPNRNPWQRWNCTFSPNQNPSADQRDRDLQLLRPFLLMRIANSIDVDQPYSPDIEQPVQYNQATGEIRAAFPPFLPNLPPGITPSPNCDQDLNAGYCACRPRIGPAFPRGLFLAANDVDQITARFMRIFDTIRSPRFQG